MLKSSSTKSAESREGVVGISGGSRNRVEPIGKYEVVVVVVISTKGFIVIY